MTSSTAIDNAKNHFATIINEQIARVEAVRNAGPPLDYGEISPVVIGIIGGDGIGPAITEVGRPGARRAAVGTRWPRAKWSSGISKG